MISHELQKKISTDGIHAAYSSCLYEPNTIKEVL